MKSKNQGDIIDRFVAWGCSLLHFDRHTHIFQQLVKFTLVGFLNTAINWTIFALALYILPISDEVVKSAIASAIAFCFAMVFNFWASITWVFDTTNRKTKKRLFIEFAIMNIVSFFLFDEAMLTWLVSLEWQPMIAKVVTTILGMIFNFITRKIFLEDHDKTKER